jgi:hypothetical protein
VLFTILGGAVSLSPGRLRSLSRGLMELVLEVERSWGRNLTMTIGNLSVVANDILQVGRSHHSVDVWQSALRG